MTRVPTEEFAKPVAVQVPRTDFETDLKRGFTVVEYSPKGELVMRNPRNPTHEIRREVPATLLFRCMRCQFDVVDAAYTPDPKDNTPRTGLEIIKKHLDLGNHPWAYTPFSNPYGNVEDVTIEGVEDYTKEITQP